jgi:predicted acyltransferase
MHTSENDKKNTQRLLSLDALRGFDMFWITGGQKIIFALSAVFGSPVFKWMSHQMHHADWDGFTFYDLIFPLFLFLSGVSMPYSITSRQNKGETVKRLYLHAIKRMLILILLGLAVNRILDFDSEHMRFASVLGRIGIAWFFAFVITLHTDIKWQVIWFWMLLIVYFLLFLLIPVPGYGTGNLTPEGNLAGYIDRLLLPGSLYMKVMDPEGILSTIPSVSTALLGVISGQFLRSVKYNLSQEKKTLILIATGIGSLLAGMLWSKIFPINKSLWSSSFVLYAGGWSLILLGLFYLIIDTWKLKKWTFFFEVIGMNSITIYVLQFRILQFDVIRDYFLKGITAFSPVNLQPFIGAFGYIACVWFLLYFLYRKKIFLKV